MDEATREVAEYMHEVKASPETESGFMTLGHRMDADRKASREEGREEGIGIGEIKTYLSLVNKQKISIEEAIEELHISSEEFGELLKVVNEQGIEALEKIIYDNHLNS